MSGGGGGTSAPSTPGYMRNAQCFSLFGVNVAGGTDLFSLSGGEFALGVATGLEGNLFRLVDDITAPTDIAVVLPFRVGGKSGGVALSSYEEKSENSIEVLDNVDTDMSTLKSEIDALTDDTAIDNAVQVFEDSLESTHFRVMNRLAASFSDINAVNSSAFAQGMVSLESNFVREISGYRRGIELQNRMHKIAVRLQSVLLKQDIANTRIVAENERTERNASFIARDTMWKLEAYRPIANMIAALSGASTMSGGTERSGLQSAISMGFSGASLGLKAGGPPGALIGGILGAGASLAFNN